MNNVILRRRKLGKGSTDGITQKSTTGLRTVRNWADSYPSDLKYVFCWGCTSNIPKGVKVVNTAASIHWCSDKRQGRLDMQEAGVPVPETWAAEALLNASRGGGFNERMYEGLYVLRPARHAQGRWLQHGTLDEVLTHADQVSYIGGYISRFIDKVAEYRVFVCQNRVVWVAKKTPGNPDQVAWNVAQGGRFDNVRWGSWPMEVVKVALAAAKVSRTDFCGVDVMVDAVGNPYVLEVNSAPSQTSDYRQSCVAKAFDFIVINGLHNFPDVESEVSNPWKSYIHPALVE